MDFRTGTGKGDLAAVPRANPADVFRFASLERIFFSHIELAGDSIHSGMWAT